MKKCWHTLLCLLYLYIDKGKKCFLSKKGGGALPDLFGIFPPCICPLYLDINIMLCVYFWVTFNTKIIESSKINFLSSTIIHQWSGRKFWQTISWKGRWFCFSLSSHQPQKVVTLWFLEWYRIARLHNSFHNIQPCDIWSWNVW